MVETHRHFLYMPRIARSTALVAPAALYACRDFAEQVKEAILDTDLVAELPTQLIELDLSHVGPYAEHIGEAR